MISRYLKSILSIMYSIHNNNSNNNNMSLSNKFVAPLCESILNIRKD